MTSCGHKDIYIVIETLEDESTRPVAVCPDCGQRTVWAPDVQLELFGSAGLEYGSFADANFRLSMTAGVAVGATEIQLNLIAQRWLGLPRER